MYVCKYVCITIIIAVSGHFISRGGGGQRTEGEIWLNEKSRQKTEVLWENLASIQFYSP
jgi:hypothetical protein